MTMEGAKHECPTFIIPDTPTKEDAFGFSEEDKSHTRVAGALSRIIKSNSNGGKMISLEGSWGSGKSSVIQKMTEEFKDSPEVSICKFDTWAHEGNPLRRTFLASIVAHFIDAELVDEHVWDKKLKQLNNEIKEETIKSKQRVTVFAILLAAAILVSQIGAAMLPEAIRQGVNFSLDLKPNYYVSFTWFFLLSPIFVLLINAIYSVVNYKYRTRRKIETRYSDYWAFITGIANRDIENISTTSPNPTSVEFEKLFKDLLNEVSSKCKELKFVLVIDNLDRVNPVDALLIWSTLQTFFQHDSEKEEWVNRLWIVVPNDPDGLKRLWKNQSIEHYQSEHNDEGHDEEGAENFGEQKSSPAVLAEEDELYKSFIEKSFQLRLRVPPIPLSNWKKFLNTLLMTALPAHSQIDRDSVFSVLSVYYYEKRSSPTPRELITIVNQIGAIHSQWDYANELDNHTYPLSDIAYYVISANDQNLFIDGLRNNNYPEQEYLSVLSSEARDNLAGLAFNLPPESGVELLLETPILDAIDDRDTELIESICEKNGKGFSAIIVTLPITRSLADSPLQLTNFLWILRNSSVLNALDDSEIARLQRDLDSAILSVERWAPLNEQVIDELFHLVKSTKNTNVVQQVFQSIKGQSITTLGEDKVIKSEEEFQKFIFLLNQIDDRGVVESDLFPLTIHCDVKSWLSIAASLKGLDKKMWRYIKPDVGSEVMQQYLTLAKGDFSTNQEPLSGLYVHFEKFYKSEDNDQWEPIFTQMMGHLGGNGKAAIEYSFYLNFLLMLAERDIQSGKEKIEQLVNSNRIAQIFESLSGEGINQCKAELLYTLFRYGAKENLQQSASQSPKLQSHLSKLDEQSAKEILDLMDAHGCLSNLINLIDKFEEIPSFLKSLFSISVSSEFIDKVYNEDIFLENYDRIDSHELLNSEEKEQTFNYFNKRGEINNAILKDETDIFSNAKTLLLAAKSSPDDSVDLWCKEKFSEFSEGEWDKVFAPDKSMIELQSYLTQKGAEFNFGAEYFDAVKKFAERIATRNISVTSEPKKLGKLMFLCLDSHVDFQAGLKRELLKILVRKSPNIRSEFFLVFGDELLDVELLLEDTDVVSDVFVGIFKEGDNVGLDWLLRLVQLDSEIVAKYNNKMLTDSFEKHLLAAMGSCESDADSERMGFLSGIASTLGISTTKQDDDPEEESETKE